MNQQRTFIDDLKYQYQHGGATIKLIFINVAIFLVISILNAFLTLGGMQQGSFISLYADPLLGLQSTFGEFITHPWGLFTYMFTHFSLMHILFNMLFLFYSGRIFEQLLGKERLVYTYILGGLLGGALQLLAYAVFPKFEMLNTVVVGASGSIMAIFVAVAFYRPQLKIHLFGIIEVRIIWVALFFILMDILDLGGSDNVAHFAHLGGAIFGFLSIQNIQSSSNIVNRFQRFVESFKQLFKSGKRSRKHEFRVKKGGNPRTKTDEEYAAERTSKQELTDKILDKISKSGYDSLTKKEKEFLFNQSKNG